MFTAFRAMLKIWRMIYNYKFKEPLPQTRVEMAQTKPEGWDKVPARGCRSEPSQPEIKVMVPILTCSNSPV